MNRYLIGLLLWAAALTTDAAAPASVASEGPLTPKELKAARQIYLGKCARCHAMYDPNKYSDKQWTEWMEKMRRKSRLKQDQYRLLLVYTETLRSQENPSKVVDENPNGN